MFEVNIYRVTNFEKFQSQLVNTRCDQVLVWNDGTNPDWKYFLQTQLCKLCKVAATNFETDYI